MLQENIVEKIQTHILCSISFYRKSRRFFDNVKKHGRTREAKSQTI